MSLEVVSLGCRLNLAESEALRAMLHGAGEITVINSCAVTAEAVRQTNITNRMMLGGAIKFNAKGQVEGNLSAAIQNIGMKPTVVLPASAAETAPIFPVPEYRKA